MSNGTFNVRSEILSTIAKTSDEAMRSVLLLMLGVLDEIGNKIDGVRQDEQSLRDTVLNGHAADHDEHHRWVEARMKDNCGDACAWAHAKMLEEAEAAKNHKSLWQKFLEGAATHAGSLIAGGIIAWAFMRGSTGG